MTPPRKAPTMTTRTTWSEIQPDLTRLADLAASNPRTARNILFHLAGAIDQAGHGDILATILPKTITANQHHDGDDDAAA